jgi:uncharacterized protein YndB with AHSA1/START domain
MVQLLSCVWPPDRTEDLDMSDEQRVERSVDVPLEPERAWETVTDPDELERWLAPDVELDLREGGDVFVRDEDGRERHGTVVTVDPPQRLVYTWGTDGVETTVEIELDPLPDGTRIRISETPAEARLLALAA